MLTVAQIKGRQLIPGEIPVERRCVRSFHMREFLAGDRRNEYPAFSAWILVSFTQFGTISVGLNAQDGWLKSLLRAIKAAQDGRISRKGQDFAVERASGHPDQRRACWTDEAL